MIPENYLNQFFQEIPEDASGGKAEPGGLGCRFLLETTDAVFKLQGPADVIHSSQQALSGEIIDFEGIIQSCRRTDRFLLQIDFQLAPYVGSHLLKKGLNLGLVQHHQQNPVLPAIVEEDIGETRTNDAAEPIV